MVWRSVEVVDERYELLRDIERCRGVAAGHWRVSKLCGGLRRGGEEMWGVKCHASVKKIQKI